MIEAPRTRSRDAWHHVYGSLAGSRVVIVGNSPSATAERLEVLRHAYHVVIGTNRVCRIAPEGTIDVVVVADIGILESATDSAAIVRQKPVAVFAHSNVFGDPAAPHPIQARGVYVAEFELAGEHDLELPRSKTDPIMRTGSSPAMAVQMAVLLGAAEVAILGVDHTAPELRAVGAPTHCYATGDDVGPRRPTGGSDTLRAIQVYRAIRIWAESRGVRCANLSPVRDAPIHRAGWERCPVD